jgi:hypothetical protein
MRRASGRSVAANTLASGASDRGCESLRPDQFIAVSSNSRTTGFEPVDGGAGVQQRDRATEGRARSAEREEREPILLPQPNGAWDCVAWSSPWQGEFQAGATPAGSTNFSGRKL